MADNRIDTIFYDREDDASSSGTAARVGPVPLNKLELVLNAGIIHQQSQPSLLFHLFCCRLKYVLHSRTGIGVIRTTIVIVSAADNTMLQSLHITAYVSKLISWIDFTDMSKERTTLSQRICLIRLLAWNWTCFSSQRPWLGLIIIVKSIEKTFTIMQGIGIGFCDDWRIVKFGQRPLEAADGSAVPPSPHQQGCVVTSSILQIISSPSCLRWR